MEVDMPHIIKILYVEDNSINRTAFKNYATRLAKPLYESVDSEGNVTPVEFKVELYDNKTDAWKIEGAKDKPFSEYDLIILDNQLGKPLDGKPGDKNRKVINENLPLEFGVELGKEIAESLVSAGKRPYILIYSDDPIEKLQEEIDLRNKQFKKKFPEEKSPAIAGAITPKPDLVNLFKNIKKWLPENMNIREKSKVLSPKSAPPHSTPSTSSPSSGGLFSEEQPQSAPVAEKKAITNTY